MFHTGPSQHMLHHISAHARLLYLITDRHRLFGCCCARCSKCWQRRSVHSSLSKSPEERCVPRQRDLHVIPFWLSIKGGGHVAGERLGLRSPHHHI